MGADPIASPTVAEAVAAGQDCHRPNFDPQIWLEEFERCGGWLKFDEQGAAAAQWSLYGNSEANQTRIAEMLRNISEDQMSHVVAARKAEAARFQAGLWCVEFNAAGGSVFAMDGQPWTGISEQADDRAFRMRNRLMPEETAKLRSFLRHHLELEMVH